MKFIEDAALEESSVETKSGWTMKHLILIASFKNFTQSMHVATKFC